MAPDSTVTSSAPADPSTTSELSAKRTRRRYIDDGAGTPYTCPTCGAMHIRDHRGQKYCGHPCRIAGWKAHNVQRKAGAARGQQIREASERGTLTRRLDGTFAARTANAVMPEIEPADMPAERVERENVVPLPSPGSNRAANDDSGEAETGAARLSRYRFEDGTSGADWAAAGNRWQAQVQPSRILAVTGHGSSVRVEKGQLIIRQGVTHSVEHGAVRETLRLSRGLHHISCIVMLGRHGGLTLDALQWCQDQGIGVLVIDRQGELTSVVTPPAGAKISLRRAQYAADPVEMARDTLLRKIAAQVWAQPELVEWADIARREARAATTCDELRLIEGRLATCYWLGWRDLQVTWKGPGIPDEWRRFETRSSWNGTPRHARHPVNAALNLAYHVLAGRIERAIVARGLDPAVGSLHTERDGRNSLTYDLVEALRPRVDVKLLTWMGQQTWRRADFTVDTAGVVRLHPALARVIVQVSYLPDNLIEGEVDHYLAVIREPATTEQLVGPHG
jgi:CRISPR-associated protein Cas1